MNKPVSTSLVLATILGSLLLVGGLTAIVFNFRYHYGESIIGSFAAITLGLLLIVMAFLSESPGPHQRTFAIARDVLIALFCLGLILVLLLILIGPLH
jgi:uncharacterized membrane protein HdeD (DUF308 family)